MEVQKVEVKAVEVKVEVDADFKSAEQSSSPPHVDQVFSRQYHNGCLVDWHVYNKLTAASVRLYAHSPKALGDAPDIFFINNDSGSGDALSTTYRATIVLPQLYNPCDVRMLLNMVHAAVNTSIPDDLRPLPLSPSPWEDNGNGNTVPLSLPLPLSPDSDVILLQLLDGNEVRKVPRQKKAKKAKTAMEGAPESASVCPPESPESPEFKKAREARELRTRELVNIGFRVVGRMSDGMSPSTGDLTANWVVWHGAIIFKANLRTLLATPSPDGIAFTYGRV